MMKAALDFSNSLSKSIEQAAAYLLKTCNKLNDAELAEILKIEGAPAAFAAAIGEDPSQTSLFGALIHASGEKAVKLLQDSKAFDRINLGSVFKASESESLPKFVREMAKHLSAEQIDLISGDSSLSIFKSILANKGFNKALISQVVESQPRLAAEAILETGFVLDRETAVTLICLNDDEIGMKFLKAFPSIPFEAQDLIYILNATDGLNELVAQVFESKFGSNLSVATHLIDRRIYSPLMLDLFKDSDDEVKLFLLKIIPTNNLSGFPIHLSHSYARMIHKADLANRVPMSLEALLEILSSDFEFERWSSLLSYREVLEEVELNSTAVSRLAYVPKSSRHYKAWSRVPRESKFPTGAQVVPALEDHELLKTFRYFDPGVMSHYWRRDDAWSKMLIGLAQEADGNVKSEHIERLYALGFDLGPKAFADAVKGTMSDQLYQLFAPRLSLKHKQELGFVEKGEGKRSSFYKECFESVCDRNVDEFLRWARTSPYSVAKFFEDTNQLSKKNQASRHFPQEILAAMTKEEFLSFPESAFVNRSLDYEEISHRLTPYELELFKYKIEPHFLIGFAVDPEAYVASFNKVTEVIDTLKAIDEDSVFYNDAIVTTLIEKLVASGPKNVGHEMLIQRSPWNEDDSNLFQLIDGRLPQALAKKVVSLNGLTCELKNLDGQYVFDVKDIATYAINREDSKSLLHVAGRDSAFMAKLTTAFDAGIQQLNKFLGTSFSRRSASLTEMMSQFAPAKPEKRIPVGKNATKALIKSGYDLEELHRLYGAKAGEIAKEMPEVKWTLAKIWSLSETAFIYPGMHVEITLAGLDEAMLERISKMENASAQIANARIFNILVTGIGRVSRRRYSSCISDKHCSEILLALKAKGFSNLRFDEATFPNLAIKHIVPLIEGGINLPASAVEKAYIDDVEDLDLALKHGFPITQREFSIGDSDKLEWVRANLPELAENIFFLESSWTPDGTAARKLGFPVLPSHEYEIEKYRRAIIRDPRGFADIDLSDLTHPQVMSLIKCAIEHDPRMKKIMSINIQELEILSNYNAMESFLTLDDGAMKRIYNLTDKLGQNRKLIKSLISLTALKPSLPTYFTHLSDLLVEFTGNKAEVTEVVDIQPDGSALPKPLVTKIDLSALLSLRTLLLNPLALFKNIKRDQIMGLLKKADAQTYKDTAEMAKRVFDALESLDDQVANNRNLNSEERADFENTAKGFRAKLSKIAGIIDIDIIHDNLSEMASSIQNDPRRPCNPPYITSIARDKRLKSEVGYNLFFPSTAGDLGAMGSQHGWCVASSSSYIEGVTGNGNVLVGFVPADKPSSVENCVALAHYRRRDVLGGKSEFIMDQLRWSVAVKGSQQNAEADFPHGKVNALIVEYYEKAMKKISMKSAA